MVERELASLPTTPDHSSLPMAAIESATTAVKASSQWDISVRSVLALTGAFLALFCTLGFQNAFGVFHEYYGRAELKGYSDFDIAWIGALLTFMFLFCAAPAGILVDRVGPTPLLAFGSLGTIFATFMTSLCDQYYQFILAQGLTLGVSNAFLLTPAMTTVSHLFDKYRGTATGIMIAGSSIGGIIWPIMLDQLLNKRQRSFGWSLRIAGFVMIPVCLLITLAIRVPSKRNDARQADNANRGANNGPSKEKKADISTVKNPTFILLCIGLSVATFGLFAPLFFIPTYAVANGLSASLAFYLISMLNGASLVGRVSMGYLADKYGNLNLCFATTALTGVIAMCWNKATSKAAIIIFALACGYTSGAMFILQTPCAVQLATPESRGTAIGLLMIAPALPGLVGTPISGRLVPKGYLALSMYAGAFLLAGSALILWARLRQNSKVLSKV
ncbi:Major Facilitator Superfamily protein [Coccidioides posadasii C735 delta SOWgp]|uniref:Major Facilitator Superfamily protein n=1 Tax=Coccidioides posadasii (strain C735) TaxID=222929 RepID=C5P2Y2_COCP7|nr:Major Facilitator Superfamily protein [Coccidioides posadasii C735 delta SOWgp]EER28670.1 Major Facilitator Superfamily protein [Coccidioides posadasii C735 delta SOWgp]|eukprot:XP_003070815.1 Major Facilitator Superfamily protein [Coccidioides posadasii C735 delta SOWgp]